MNISTSKAGVFQVLLPELSGDELFDSVALEEKTKTLSASGMRYIAVDLSSLDYIYSDTINKIIGINRTLLSISGRIVIIAPHPKVFSILTQVGVDKQVKIVRSLEELNTLSQLLLENFPDLKAQPSTPEEKPAPEQTPENPKDEFSDFKNMLSESLTIGEATPTAKEPAAKPETIIEPEPIEPIVEQPKAAASDFDDMFVEFKEEEKPKPAPEPKVEPKEDVKFVASKEIEFDVSPEPQAVEAEQPKTAPVIKPTMPKTTDFVISNGERKTSVKPSFEAETDNSKKNTDWTKIVLMLIILLLIAVVAGLLTGVFSPKAASDISETTNQTATAPIPEEKPEPAPTFDEPAKKTEVKPAPAPKPQTQTKAQTKAQTDAKKTQPAAKSSDLVTITTTPAGAFIYMNGDYIGKSPVSVDRLPYGNLSFRARLDGFEEHEWKINFEGGRRQLTINLQRPVAQTQQTQQPAQQQQATTTQQQQQQQLANQQAAQEAARQQQLQQQEAQRLAAEQSARDEANRRAQEDQLRRQQQQAASEQAARDQALREQQAREQQQREQAAREQAAKEEAARKAAAEEAARKEAEAAQEAEIFFSSMPPRAEIFQNGVKVGQANITPIKVKPGQHTFEFRLGDKTATWSGNLRNGKNPQQMIRIQ